MALPYVSRKIVTQCKLGIKIEGVGTLNSVGERSVKMGTDDFYFAALLALNVLSGGSWIWRLFRVKGQRFETDLLKRLLTAIGISTLISLATIPSAPPFQPHHSFGIGLLGSLIGASLAFWVGILKSRIWLSYLGVLVPFIVPLIFHPGNPFPSLFGLMVGMVLVWFCLGNIWNSYGLTAISLAVAVGLARLHECPTITDVHFWQSLPLWLGISGWLGIGFLRSWQRYWQKELGTFGSVLTSSVILVLGAVLISYWSEDWRFSSIALLTCFAAIIALKIQQTELPDLTALLWVGLLIVSFAAIPETEGMRLLSGYGASLAAVSLAWIAAGRGKERNPLLHGAALMVTFALFRLFFETHPLRAPRADLYTHYTFVGFLLGAIIPALLMRWMEQERRFLRELVVGFWAAFSPIIFGAIWGVKAVVGYLAGTIATTLLIFPSNLPTVFAGFLSSLPLAALVEPVSDLPRKVRALILLVAALAFALSLMLDRLARKEEGGA